jgi:hypothetical protein
MSGTLAYVADGEAGVRVIDVASPAAPREIGFVDTPGYAWGVFLAGSRLYVADGAAGLRILDVAEPAAAREVGSHLPADGDVRGVHVAGGRAYLAAGRAGLVVLDLSDPTKPVAAGRAAVPRGAQSVAVSGGRAYVGAVEWLRVYDVSNAGAPREIAAHETPAFVKDVWVEGGTAHVAADQAGLLLYDLGPAPAAP